MVSKSVKKIKDFKKGGSPSRVNVYGVRVRGLSSFSFIDALATNSFVNKKRIEPTIHKKTKKKRCVVK